MNSAMNSGSGIQDREFKKRIRITERGFRIQKCIQKSELGLEEFRNLGTAYIMLTILKRVECRSVSGYKNNSCLSGSVDFSLSRN